MEGGGLCLNVMAAQWRQKQFHALPDAAATENYVYGKIKNKIDKKNKTQKKNATKNAHQMTNGLWIQV